jgi:hypothetical protein
MAIEKSKTLAIQTIYMIQTKNSIKVIGIIASLIIIVACSTRQNKTETSPKNQTELAKNSIPDYNIDFPETKFKVEKTESRDPKIENVLVTNWILQGADNNGPFMYFVAHNKLPQGLKTQIDKEINSMYIAFQAMLMGSATKLGGTDFEFKRVVYKNYQGMESICKVFNGDGIIKSRVFMIEDNLFMISAGGKKINMQSVDKFLNSFRLKN